MKLTFALIILLSQTSLLIAQSKKDTLSDWDRTFMPAIQLGYVDHGSSQLSGGIMGQTSIEYRHKSDFVLRVNYDNLNAHMDFDYPINPNLTYSGDISFTDIIGGIGFRDIDGKHNFTYYVQGGVRNYGYPVFNENNGVVNLSFTNVNIGIVRYSFGYEFALAPKLFLSIETLVSQTLASKDFWADNRWSYGATVGLAAPLF